MFFNDNNNGNIQKYSKEQNGFYVPISYNGGKINHAVQIDKNNYLFASNKQLKWYQYKTSSITTMVDNVDVTALEYDPISNIIYLVSGNSINKYSFPDGQLLNSYIFSETIIDFHLIYNIP